MITAILQGLPQKQADIQEGKPLQPKTPSGPSSVGFGGARPTAPTPTRDLKLVGRELLKSQRGEAFALHYHAAFEAAGALQGKDFLEQYRALKRVAREQGMSETEFHAYEKCLYRRFYQAAARDTVRAHQAGLKPKVEPGELAYIAKVADIPEDQIRRDSLIFQKCEFVAQIHALRTRNRSYPA